MKCENMKLECLSNGGVYMSEADIHTALCKARTQDIDIYCYENLANAIVVQAAEDYKRVLKGIIKRPTEKLYKKKFEIEDFFHSLWYRTLTSVDANWLLEKLQFAVREEENERLKKAMLSKKDEFNQENGIGKE